MKKFRMLTAILLLWSMLVYVGCRKDKFDTPPAQNTAVAERNATNSFGQVGADEDGVLTATPQFYYPKGAQTTVDLEQPEEEGEEEASSDERLRNRLLVNDASVIEKSYIDNTHPQRLYWTAEGIDKKGRNAKWAIPVKVINGVIIIRVCFYIYYVVCYQAIFCRFIRDPWTGRIIGISCVPGVICHFYWIKYCYWVIVFVREADPMAIPASRVPAMLPKRE